MHVVSKIYERRRSSRETQGGLAMRVPNRLSGSLPVSIAAHAVVICLLFVIPLAAEIALPVLPSTVDAYMRAVPAPPPPPAPAIHPPGPAVRAATVPIEAPPAIVPEHP